MPNNVSIGELLPGIILVGAMVLIVSILIYGAIFNSPKEYEVPKHYTEEIK